MQRVARLILLGLVGMICACPTKYPGEVGGPQDWHDAPIIICISAEQFNERHNKWAAGTSFYPYIYLRSGYCDNQEVIAHETVHWTEQREISLEKWDYYYNNSKTFKYNAELRAYCESVRWGLSVEFAVYTLLNDYGVNADHQNTFDALEKCKG